jgi:hypothetical protein
MGKLVDKPDMTGYNKNINKVEGNEAPAVRYG